MEPEIELSLEEKEQALKEAEEKLKQEKKALAALAKQREREEKEREKQQRDRDIEEIRKANTPDDYKPKKKGFWSLSKPKKITLIFAELGFFAIVFGVLAFALGELVKMFVPSGIPWYIYISSFDIPWAICAWLVIVGLFLLVLAWIIEIGYRIYYKFYPKK